MHKRLKPPGRIVCAAAILALLSRDAHASFYDAYDDGLKAARKADWAKVVTDMSDAIRQRPVENDATRVYGSIFISYHPYYYRGIAYAHLGQFARALDDLERATKAGAVDLGTVQSWMEKIGSSHPLAQAVPPPEPAVPPPAPAVPPPTQPASSPTQAVRRAHPVARPHTAHTPKATAVPAVQSTTQATTSVPTAQTTTDGARVTSAATYPADQELTEVGAIAFNTPQDMIVGEQKVIELLLDSRRAPLDIARTIREDGTTQTAYIKISKTVEARVTGATFDVRAITPELQPISAFDTTEWRWEITPKEQGKHRLFLTINDVIGTGAGQQRRSIRTYDRAIEVRVSPRALAGRYAIVAGVAIVLLAGAIFLVRSRRAPSGNTDDSVTVRTAIQRSPIAGGGFEPGQIVDERYRIVRLLGKGGMGAVYAAEDLELDSEMIAIKTILGSSADERALARLRREIQVARRVAHPNVCRVFDVGFHSVEWHEAIFVTMEYIAGRTLSQIIRDKGRLDERAALPIVRGLAAGLDATHRAGLIHRDVKSANVMVAEKDGRPVLMDFGLARARLSDTTPSLTQTGAVVGSPMYMAPEQLQDVELTPATDIYAFGTVMFEMVTGHLPFEGDTAMTILARRLQEDPVPPSQFVPDLDPVWERTILKCLNRDPALRFQQALEVSSALQQADETTQAI